MKKLLIIAATAISSAAAAQQQHDAEPFNGLLLDNDMKGIKARIEVVGKKIYSVSNSQGKFGFSSMDEYDTLCIKFGKREFIVPVEGRRSIRIVIAKDAVRPQLSAEQDEQLISLGEAYVKNRETASSPNVVLGDRLRRYGYTTLGPALNSMVTGVRYNYEDGKIYMRGQSLNLPTAALILCDGQEVSSIDDIDIQNVDRVEVQNAPNAFGSRGANGVVLVYMRHKPTINKR